MDPLILLRRIGENLCFILWRGEPGGRTCAVKIEHDLRCARLACIHANPPNLIETRTGWRGPHLRHRLLYLSATCHSAQGDDGGEQRYQRRFHG